MAQFFITRPVLAWVISIFIVIAGLISLPSIPVAQYPQVAWPQITISTSYTGAAPGEINQSVAQPIEDELNGVEGLAYYESVSDSSGAMSITATFEPGTDVARAQVMCRTPSRGSNRCCRKAWWTRACWSRRPVRAF